jgi:hypothetical protein
MNFIAKWKDKIAHYIDVRLQLMKLSLVEKLSNVLSYLIFVFISLFISVSVLIFVGIVLGELFSGVTGSRTLGYLITTGFYVLLLIVLFLLRRPVINAFAGIFVRILTDTDEEEDEEPGSNGIKPGQN